MIITGFLECHTVVATAALENKKSPHQRLDNLVLRLTLLPAVSTVLAMATWLAVCHSRGIVSKRLNLS